MIRQEKINMDNYESWFLLYVDGELSPAQMQQVEAFAANHPHLCKELDLLLQTVCHEDEPVVFMDKNKLLKTTEDLSDEQLILFLDNELTQEDAARIQSNNDPQLAQRLALLRKTYSEPDRKIVFPHKEKLYKHTRVVSLLPKFMMSAAAIAVIVAGAWFLLLRQPVEKANIAMNPTDTEQQSHQQTTTQQSVKETTVQNIASVPLEKTEQNTVSEKATRPVVVAGKQTVARKEQAPAEIEHIQESTPQIKAVQPVPISISSRQDIAVITAVPDVEVIVPQQKKVPTAVAESISETPPDVTPVKNRKDFLANLSRKIKERTLDILSADGENIQVAGFAININK
ncbi:MAG: hypothetical protein QM727_12885 [Niabella sp.]